MKNRILLLFIVAIISIFVPALVFAGEAVKAERHKNILQTNPLQEIEFLTDEDMVWFSFDTSSYGSVRYKLFKQLGVGLAIRNRTGEIYTEATSYEPMTITITAKLQQYKNGKWQTIATYDNTEENSKISSVLKKRALTQGYSYQVVVEATADNGKITETATITSKEQYCD